MALALLAGCATPPKGPPNIPTRVKTGQSWVITRQALAAQVLDPCSRDSPARHPGEVTGYWAPSRQQLERLEADQSRLQPTIAAPADFDRQYVGIEAHGRRLIYINAFRLPDDSELDPGRSAVDVCDGGAGAWGAVYDPESGQFSDIAVGGTR
ncbi:hypothetical protein HH299_15635 [Xanthomonas sp. Kuri4-2]